MRTRQPIRPATARRLHLLPFVLPGLLGLLGCPPQKENAATPPPAPEQHPATPPSGEPPRHPAGVVATGSAARAATASTAVAASAQGPSVEEGKRLFLGICAQCHGPDGSGAMMRQMMPKIGDLTSPELHGRLTDDQIAELIKNGRDKMPPMGQMFKPEQIRSIIAYVRTLKKG